MSDPTFITRMQRFMVNASVTVSAVRQGPKAVPGVKKAASDFLCDIDVTEFADPKIFPAVLDKATENLTNAFPSGTRYWGRARKCLNIFLRECSYNSFLRCAFGLEPLDNVLETPLDRDVAIGLRDDAGAHRLPPWRAIIRLTPEENAVYQAVAAEVAQKRNTHRAHLDLWYWRPSK